LSWWNPVDWARDALSAGSGIADNVKNWVVGKVKDAVNAVEHDLGDLESLLDSAWNSAVSILSGLITQAENDVQRLRTDASGWFQDAESYADRAVSAAESDLEKAGGAIEHIAGQVVSAAIGALGDIISHSWHEVTTLFDSAESYADKAVSAFDRDVVAPVVNAVASLPGQLEQYADDAVSAFDNDVVTPIENDLDEARHDVAAAADWITNTGAEVATLVEKAADWLTLLGEHALADVENLPEQLVQELSFSGIVSYYQDNSDSLVATAQQVAAAFFGSS
jgi:phage-related protein